MRQDTDVTARVRSLDLPGAELVEPGFSDVAAGRETIEALLVASAVERFAEVGRPLSTIVPDDLSLRLYRLIEASVGDDQAHSHYNAIRRRLVSYLRGARLESDASPAGR